MINPKMFNQFICSFRNTAPIITEIEIAPI